jgi:uncharacterized protein (TIGR03437 family)
MSHLNVTRTFALLAALSLSGAVQAQTGTTVAGSGYRKPANTATAAPGQVLMVSVYGIAARISSPVFPTANNGFPTEISGISIDFVQGPVTIQLQIRGVQQGTCPAAGTCLPPTSFTIQIPYELNPDSSTQAVLQIKEGGKTAAEVALNAVTDNVRVINSCDQTGISLSLASEVPAGTCAPMAMHARGPLVSASAPAMPGETLVVWAYGLGAIEHPIPEDCCASPDQLPLAVQPFNVNLSYADAGRFPLRSLGHVDPSYVGMVGSGVYQVHFTVPAAPSSLSPCSGYVGNLLVQIGGPNSADVATICVQP